MFQSTVKRQMKYSLTRRKFAVTLYAAMANRGIQVSVEKLREAISRSDKNVPMIARELDVSPGAIWKWLKNESVAGIHPEVFGDLVKALNVTPADLKVNGSEQRRMTMNEWLERMEADAAAAGLTMSEWFKRWERLRGPKTAPLRQAAKPQRREPK